MKRSTGIIIGTALVLLCVAASTLQRQIVTTSAFWRMVLTNENGNMSGFPAEWAVSIVDRTNYMANSMDGRFSWLSNDFAGMMNRLMDTLSNGPANHFGHSIYFAPTVKDEDGVIHYVVSNTIVIRASGVRLMGAGNPNTAWLLAASNTAMVQLGTPTNEVVGLFAMQGMRFSGAYGGTNGVGFHDVNGAELDITDCEFNQFGLAGVRISTTNGLNWARISRAFFMNPPNDSNSFGILIDGAIIKGVALSPAELLVSGCSFGIDGGSALGMSNEVENVSLLGNRFRGSDTAQYCPAIEVRAGKRLAVRGNVIDWDHSWTNFIVFRARAAATNVQSVVADNTFSGGGAVWTNSLVRVEANVLGIDEHGNSVEGVSVVNLPALDNIPTNLIPVSTATYTNWVQVNWTNKGPVYIATNIAAAGSFLLRVPTTTLSAYP